MNPWQQESLADFPRDEPIGMELFDEPQDGKLFTAIYYRHRKTTLHANGLYPCRTVDRSIQPHHDDVIDSWLAKATRLDLKVVDHRKPRNYAPYGEGGPGSDSYFSVAD